jgi:DNA adenine methylase
VDVCPHRFMITYNINEWIVERYKEYQQTKFNIRYSMNHKEGDGNLKEELLIHNYNLPN